MNANNDTPRSGESVSDVAPDEQPADYSLRGELEYHGQAVRDAFFQASESVRVDGSLHRQDLKNMREALEHAERFVELVEEDVE